jgi:DNA-binding response OmpR family regulator
MPSDVLISEIRDNAQEVEAPPGQWLGSRPSRGLAAPLSNQRQVVVAHSDPELLGRITTALSRDGYRVCSTPDGLDLLDWLADTMLESGRRPGLIVAELSLPGRRGLDLLADLRFAGWSTPFILVARRGERDLAAHARRLGSAVVFESPFDIDDLRTAVAILLDQQRPAQSYPLPRPA